MNKNDQILDDFFRSRLENLEETPSPLVWEQIRKKQIVGGQFRIKKIIPLAGAAAAVLMVFFIGWGLMQKSPVEIPDVSVNLKQNVLEDSISTPDVLLETHVKTPGESLAQNKTAVDTDIDTEDLPGLIYNDLPANVNLMADNHIIEANDRREEKHLLKFIAGQISDILSGRDDKYKLLKKYNSQSDDEKLSNRERELIAFNSKYAQNKVKNSSNEWSVGAYYNSAYSINQPSNGTDRKSVV